MLERAGLAGVPVVTVVRGVEGFGVDAAEAVFELTSGDPVRPTTGGVATLLGAGLFLTAGLSQEEKKSSSSSFGAAFASPSTTTSLGYL